MELTKALVPIGLLALLSLANAGLQITKSELTGGGTLRSFTLEDDEVINRVDGKANYKKLVNQLTFITRKANSKARYGPYGSSGF